MGVNSWVEISEERLAANYKALVRTAGAGVTVLAVIKANAYSHGAQLCAPVLARAGAEWLGVMDTEEGVAVRASLAGMLAESQPKIMVMSGLLQEDAEAIVQHGLVPVVWTRQQMEWLADAVRQRGSDSPLPIHLEIDTGMARQGLAPGEELRDVLDWLAGQKNLRLDGVMTHFSSSEVAESPLTFHQREQFERAVNAVAAAGLQPGWVHAGSSSTIDNSAPGGRDRGSLVWLRGVASRIGARAMVRSGIALYGYCLPIESADVSHAGGKVRPEIRPVMTWKTRVIGVRDVQPGDTVGYNATFTAQGPMRLALLPVGYAHGLRRELSGSDTRPGGWVMLYGQRAMIVGRVSMNLTVVDVTNIPGVAVGDEAVLLGDGITADDYARLAHTIAYEIVCGMKAEPRLVDVAG